MKTKKSNRLLAMFISLCMVVGMLPVSVFAAEEQTCPHHPPHTEDCGYQEARPCGHQHAEGCYTGELICGYGETAQAAASGSNVEHTHTPECRALDCPHERGEHDDACGYAEAKPCEYRCELCGGEPSGEQETQPGGQAEPTACALTEGCTLADGHEGACVTEPADGEKETACTLTEGCALAGGHEGACVTEPAGGEKETACALTEGCTLADGHEGECVTGQPPEDAGSITVTAFDALDKTVLFAPLQTAWDGLGLPATLGASGYKATAGAEPAPEPEAISIEGITWEVFEKDGSPAAYEQGRPTPCVYWLRAVLPEGYALGDGVALPEMELRYGMALRANTPTTGAFTVTGDASQYEWNDPVLTVKDGATLTIQNTDPTTSTLHRIKVAENATNVNLTLTGVNIDLSSEGGCAFDMTGAAVTLTLAANSENVLKSGGDYAGLQVPDGATLTVQGSGKLEATGDEGAGIGGGKGGNGDPGSGGSGGNGGTVTIQGNAVVTATSDESAGIGGGKGGDGMQDDQGNGGNGGNGGSGGTVTIGGNAIVTATSISGVGIGGGKGGVSYNGVGNGGGDGGSGGTVTIGGNAIVTATSRDSAGIGGGGGFGSDGDPGTINKNGGVIFENGSGKVYGDVTLPGDLTIPTGSTLEIPSGSSLTVPDGVTLTNNGEIKGDGDLKGDGTFSGKKADRTIPAPTVASKTQTSVTLSAVTPTGDGTVTYARNTGDTAPTDGWQAGLTFTGLDPDTTYYFFARVTGGTIYKDVTSATGTAGKTDPATYTISADKGTLNFGSAALDYATAPAAQTVTITNMGNQKVTLNTSTSQNYEVGALSRTELPAGETATFTVRPKTGLAKNTYTETVTVSNTQGQSVSVSLSFTVTDKPTYAVSVTNGTGGGDYEAGAAVTITATVPGGQRFTGWTIFPDVTFTSGGKNTKTATFTMPAQAVTATANFENIPTYAATVNGGTGGGSSSGDSSDSEPQSSYKVTGDSISRSVSRSDLKRLADTGKSLTLGCGKASMTFEPAALKAILAAVPASAGSITFAAAPADLSAFPDAAKLIGSRPVYSFTISYKNSRGITETATVNFPAGAVSIALDYTPAAGEAAGSLFMVYVDDKGAVTWLDKSSYTDGKMLAEVSHFSVYGVAYKAPTDVFTDITGHWAKADIEFVAARGLLSGTSNTAFSPNIAMTRGMFVTALGRLAGVNPQSYKTRSFTDVKADAYYAAYVEWAAKNNIVKGTGDKLFSPDAPVTREQMAVMMTNYAGQMGYSIPAPLAAVTFTDNNKIGAWAAKEVAAMQRAGIIKGKDGGRFDPQASATRAEGSAVLRRFVEIVIDPATAQGWVKNDSGQWLYYKDGKTLTGWQKIGGNWYYFYSTGAMAVNTKIDGYVIGPDGKRKEDN